MSQEPELLLKKLLRDAWFEGIQMARFLNFSGLNQPRARFFGDTRHHLSPRTQKDEPAPSLNLD